MKIIKVFTDGSTFNNQRLNSPYTFGGVGVFFGLKDKRNISEAFYLFPITNNRCEIYAVILAIQSAMKDKITRGDKCKDKMIIHTDSMYVINSITKWINKWKLNGWKTSNGKDVKNKDLLYSLDKQMNLYKKLLDIEFKHVKAHKTAPKNKKSNEYELWFGNMMADKLAIQGSKLAKQASKE